MCPQPAKSKISFSYPQTVPPLLQQVHKYHSLQEVVELLTIQFFVIQSKEKEGRCRNSVFQCGSINMILHQSNCIMGAGQGALTTDMVSFELE